MHALAHTHASICSIHSLDTKWLGNETNNFVCSAPVSQNYWVFDSKLLFECRHTRRHCDRIVLGEGESNVSPCNTMVRISKICLFVSLVFSPRLDRHRFSGRERDKRSHVCLYKLCGFIFIQFLSASRYFCFILFIYILLFTISKKPN